LFLNFSFVNSEPIVGYDVYLSEDKDQPEQQWRHIPLDSREASLSLNNLKSGTTYFVKVNVRNRDGTVLKGRSVYRFRTMGMVGWLLYFHWWINDLFQISRRIRLKCVNRTRLRTEISAMVK
jgi:hypothetical protein